MQNLSDDIIRTNRITGDKKDKYERLFWLYAHGTSSDAMDEIDRLSKELGESTTSGLLGIFGRKLNNYEPKRPEYRSIPSDYGVLAAMLGYDAINAVGHGESKSYTVVLNRTKLIISEEKVDLEE